MSVTFVQHVGEEGLYRPVMRQRVDVEAPRISQERRHKNSPPHVVLGEIEDQFAIDNARVVDKDGRRADLPSASRRARPTYLEPNNVSDELDVSLARHVAVVGRYSRVETLGGNVGQDNDLDSLPSGIVDDLLGEHRAETAAACPSRVSAKQNGVWQTTYRQ